MKNRKYFTPKQAERLQGKHLVVGLGFSTLYGTVEAGTQARITGQQEQEEGFGLIIGVISQSRSGSVAVRPEAFNRRQFYRYFRQTAIPR